MEKPSSSKELQCIGTLEVVRPRPVGFLCGSIHVPTDKAYHLFLDSSALVPSSPHLFSAPRYRQLPRETDLNALPVVSNLPEKVLPSTTMLSKSVGDLHWEGETILANLSRKCEALAVSGVVDYGDEIDVIAPIDILKQIFKMPYSKSRLSIVVRRIGQTLVLNTGPDTEEGEKLVRRHKGQATCAEHSLYSNFAIHSVRVEACDCPPNHQMSTEEKSSSCLSAPENISHTLGQCYDAAVDGEPIHSEYPWVKQEDLQWGIKSAKVTKDHHPVKKGSYVQESDKHKRVGNDGFLHALFWNFHNFRMLLGSDMLIFSNEKYVAVSLHLWDVTRKVTPLTWLDAWLDNVMASVPELAICYHHNGVVQSYELLKTEEIIRKGISEDGYSAFHPHVVQQNGLSVLRFLQENCKQDPGAYWLHKSAGEDVIQLFDLSAIPNCSSNCDHDSSSLPSLVHRGRSDALLSLGTLLYRIGHRLSLSLVSNDRAKCAAFFRKCLEVLDDPDHLVVRAFAHEQLARVLLSHDKEFELTSECLPLEYKVAVFELLDNSDSGCELFLDEHISSLAEEGLIEGQKISDDTMLEVAGDSNLETYGMTSKHSITSVSTEVSDSHGTQPVEESLAVCKTLPSSSQMLQTISDHVSSKLAAIHNVSLAIKSLRWKRQLQGTESEVIDHDNRHQDIPHEVNLSICICGDADCIEVCDIREWLPTLKIDNQLWKLVRLLGESYLSLGQTFTEENQLVQALNVVKIACSVYGSMPQHFGNARFMSSIERCSSLRKRIEKNQGPMSYGVDEEAGSNGRNDCFALEQFSSTCLFWAKAWTLVGDVHVQFYRAKGKELSKQARSRLSSERLKVSSEVVKEVQRLKKKLVDYGQSCSSCSLVNCSCQSDRASSGSGASSSAADQHALAFGKKPGRRTSGRNAAYSNAGNFDSGHIHHEVGTKTSLNCEEFDVGNGNSRFLPFGTIEDGAGMKSLTVDNSETTEDLPLHHAGYKMSCKSELSIKQNATRKKGGIFMYLCDSAIADVEYNLSAALCCYKEARKVVCGNFAGSEEFGSVTKKLGWVCNEMGRNRLERRQLIQAELAFADAVSAFREVSDFTNIILIYCNLGHGRRALAEDITSNLENHKSHTASHDKWKQGLETAKIEYSKSIGYYGAAKSELVALKEGANSVPSNLRNDVCTQYAHTYLRLGMLLAREDSTAELCESKTIEDVSNFQLSPCGRQAKKKFRKRETTASDAITEAVSLYESLGELRKQEAAYAYFQLACYQRDCCLKFMQSDYKKYNSFKGKNNTLLQVKQYASLAEKNWQRALEFYGPVTHPFMYLSIIIERSALSLSLSSVLHSYQMLGSALSHMLEGRHIPDATTDSFASDYPETHEKFWNQLRMILRKILSTALSANSTKASTKQPPTPPDVSADSGKLRELYGMSLKFTDLSQLEKMHFLWTS